MSRRPDRAEPTSDVYAQLGVARVVNAADTMTRLGGGPLDPRVIEAMAAAADRYVDMSDLLERAGSYIAQRLGVPAALVTNSAVSAVSLAIAGAIAGAGPAAVDRAPRHETARREVVVLCAQRNPYDRAVRIGGGELVEAGYSDGTEAWQLDAAITERTAAVLWYAGTQFENYALDLESTVSVARDRGVPVVVDAAAQLPPVSNLWDYVARGADAVAFSGGKGLRAPQDTAMLVGRAGLVEAARAHAFPHYGIGRAMKVGKEAVCGLVVAVQLALDADEDAGFEALRARCETIAAELADVPGVAVSIVPEGVLGQRTPRVRLDLAAPHGPTAEELSRALLAHDPPVWVRTESILRSAVFVNPFPLEPDDDALVVRAVRRAVADLGGAGR